MEVHRRLLEAEWVTESLPVNATSRDLVNAEFRRRDSRDIAGPNRQSHSVVRAAKSANKLLTRHPETVRTNHYIVNVSC